MASGLNATLINPTIDASSLYLYIQLMSTENQGETMFCSRRWMLFIGLLGLFASLGCSGDKDTNPAGPVNSIPKEPLIVILNAPDRAMMLSGNNYAGQASELIGVSKSFKDLFAPPPGSGKISTAALAGDDSSVYVWTVDQLTIKLIRKTTSDAYSWEVIYDGSKAGIQYFNWTIIRAEQMKDGSSGWMELHRENTTQIDRCWEWSSDTHRNVTVNMTWVEGQKNIRVSIAANSNGTGLLEYYENGTILWKVSWAAEGASASGMWYLYNNGLLSASATWMYSSGG